ncbi:hypothetical protein ACA910_017860 [Epithemia clementina (nom. ined.)]
MAGTTTISNETLKAKVEELAGKVDLETTGFKQFVSLLTKELGGTIDLKQQKPFIKECLLETIQEKQGSNPETEENNDDDGGDEDHHYGEDEDDEDEEDAPATKPAKKKGGGGGGGGGGLAALKPISAALAQFFGRGTSSSEAQMARTDVVKRLWEYIREHKLQNPQNRREVMLDAALQKVFGVPQFTIFTMNKYVSAHIYPFKPVDLTTSSNPYKKRKNPSSGAAASSSKEGAAEKAAKTARRKAAAAGTQPPWRLSDELQAVVGGASTLPRPQVVSKIWEYIRAHNLQNPKDKREILCDDKLSRVMGGQTTVTMFTLNRYISPHLLEKLGGGGGSGGGGGKGEKQETSQTKKKKTTKKHEAPPVANQQEEDGDFDEE